jgi:hypothetical protein
VFLILKIINELPKDKSKRNICPNIFLDENNMAWSKKKRNLYVAQNIISMQPFSWRDDTYFKFINENDWIRKYYKNFNLNYQGRKTKIKKDSPLMALLEKIARKKEMEYMKKDITTEVVNPKLIHFNKNDSTKKILSKYKEILKKYQNSQK